jgi:riboflavin kinase
MADVASEKPRPEATQTISFRSDRPQIVGPDAPEPPFPIRLSGPVQRGFGRGGKDLGCPTGLQRTLLTRFAKILI